MQIQLSAKIVVIGSVGVGKSSLTIRFVHQQFNQNMDSTLGAVYFQKTISMKGRKIKLQFWDTAGQQKYKAIARIYYKDCRVALLVYDISNRNTFQALKMWIQQLRNNGPENVILVIVGNKVDIDSNNQVSYQQAQTFANSIGALFKYTSAKDGKGVKQLFEAVGNQLLNEQIAPKKNQQKLKKNKQSKKKCC